MGMTSKLPLRGNLRRANSLRPSIEIKGPPNTWFHVFGNIPTNEELMIAMDTAALVKG